MSIEEMRGELDGLMVFIGSLAYGLEHVLGRGAASINYRAGKSVGMKGEVPEKREDLLEALEVLDGALKKRGINWQFKPWKPAAAQSFVYDNDGKPAVKLSFHNCMVRCALFRFSHEQKQSLCQMEMGLLCGLLQKITGKRADLKVLHAGENACLKELTIAD